LRVATCPQETEKQEDEMPIPNLETFAFQFIKLVEIFEEVRIDKEIDVDVFVVGNSALANAKGESEALGPNTTSETAAFTSTFAVEGVGSSSSSIAESMAATNDAHVLWPG
jgi:hypothetical protein